MKRATTFDRVDLYELVRLTRERESLQRAGSVYSNASLEVGILGLSTEGGIGGVQTRHLPLKRFAFPGKPHF